MRRGHTRRQSPAGPTLLFRDKLSPCPFSQPAFSCLPQVLFRPPLFFLPRLTSEYRRERGNIQFHKVKERFNLDVSPTSRCIFHPMLVPMMQTTVPCNLDARQIIEVGAGLSHQARIWERYTVATATRNATFVIPREKNCEALRRAFSRDGPMGHSHGLAAKTVNKRTAEHRDCAKGRQTLPR